MASERCTSSAVNGFIRQPSARSGIGKRGALPLTNRHGTPKSLSRTATEKPVVAVREMEVEQDQIGLVQVDRGNRAVGILGGGHDPIARIVLDQIFERFRQLRSSSTIRILSTREPPRQSRKLSRKIRDLMLARNGAACESPVNRVYRRAAAPRQNEKGARNHPGRLQPAD